MRTSDREKEIDLEIDLNFYQVMFFAHLAVDLGLILAFYSVG